MSVGAGDLLTDFHNYVEIGQRSGEAFERIDGFASKIPELVCRLAAALTLFADADAEQVSTETMENALEIGEWYLWELHRLRECGYVSPEIRDAERLRLWLCQKGVGALVTIRMILREGPKPSRTAVAARKMMAMIEENGWVMRLPANSEVNGSTTKLAWKVLWA